MAQTENSVEQIRKQLELQRKNLYANLAEIETNLDSVERALTGLTGQEQLPPPDMSPARDRLRRHMQQIAQEPERPGPRKSIGDDKLESIRDYLRAHPRARQRDIEDGTKLNSGTVSVAKDVLLEQGEIEVGGKERRSYVWHWKGDGRTR